jgi:hypothetical protein
MCQPNTSGISRRHPSAVTNNDRKRRVAVMSELLPGYIRDTEFAELLKEKTGYGSTQTLYNWRRRGIGPKWVRIGRAVMYPVDQEFDQIDQPASNKRLA